MKKTRKLLVIFMIFNILIQYVVLADDELEDVDNEVNATEVTVSPEVEVLSKHCICIERSTGQVLFEKDAYTKCAMASTTKILTGIIVIENCDLNEEVEISKKAAGIGGSTLGISAGQKITIETLLYGLLLRSGNDTAIALAEHVAGSVEEFSKIMNIKAKAIGLKNSNFVTPHGLDDDNHYTTAYDLAILTNYALNNEVFSRIVGTKQITINIGNYQRVLNNTNELLGNVKGVYGVKTGFTGNAGRCLVTACKRNDLDIIVVVLGADTKKIRGSDSKKIIEYIFDSFKMVDTEKEIEDLFNNFKNIEKIKSLKSLDEIEINYRERENYICPLDKNKTNKLKTSIYCLTILNAPIEIGTVIGKIRLICDDKILYEIDVYLDKKLYRMNWKDYLEIFVKKYITFYSI